MGTVAGIVLAGGYGCLAQPTESKLVAVAGNQPIVRRPVHILSRELRLSPTMVVTNSDYDDQVRRVLADYELLYAVQTKRIGAAGAVGLCLPQLQTQTDVVVLYGDMPCWKPNTIRNLLLQHLARRSIITMFRIDLRGSYGQLVRNFGRILYDAAGQLIGVREPYELTQAELAKTCFVNPGAWVFNMQWLRAQLPQLPPHDKGDGFPHEYWLHDLVPMALAQQQLITQVDLLDAREALGVNNVSELETVQNHLGSNPQQEQRSEGHVDRQSGHVARIQKF